MEDDMDRYLNEALIIRVPPTTCLSVAIVLCWICRNLRGWRWDPGSRKEVQFRTWMQVTRWGVSAREGVPGPTLIWSERIDQIDSRPPTRFDALTGRRLAVLSKNPREAVLIYQRVQTPRNVVLPLGVQSKKSVRFRRATETIQPPGMFCPGGMGATMDKPAQNIQDGFLNNARKEKGIITIYLLSGVKLSGRIKSFDKYSLVLETNNQEQLIFKHAISTVVTLKSHLQHSPSGHHGTSSSVSPSAPPAPVAVEPSEA